MPPGITGGIATRSNNLLPVKISIGGLDAAVVYAGSAPDEVSGILQVNAVVPQNTVSGDAVPLVLEVGTRRSQPAVTIAVQ
jgi:uncharacterized protein (TIGR03437 family)